MSIFMVLLEKLGILTFDMPDDAAKLYHMAISQNSRPPSQADIESQNSSAKKAILEISPQ
jgi:hypothetical protein